MCLCQLKKLNMAPALSEDIFLHAFSLLPVFELAHCSAKWELRRGNPLSVSHTLLSFINPLWYSDVLCKSRRVCTISKYQQTGLHINSHTVSSGRQDLDPCQLFGLVAPVGNCFSCVTKTPPVYQVDQILMKEKLLNRWDGARHLQLKGHFSPEDELSRTGHSGNTYQYFSVSASGDRKRKNGKYDSRRQECLIITSPADELSCQCAT